MNDPDTAVPVPAPRWYRRLYVWILAAMVLGAVTGLVAPEFGKSLEVLGDTFVSLLTMLLGPIIFCMVVAGIATVANLRQVGKVALRSIVYFEIVTTIALVLGLVVVNLVRPGAGMGVDAGSLAVSDEVAERTAAGESVDWTHYFTQLVPENIVGSFAEGAVLQILFFSVLFGVALAVIGEPARPIARGVERLSHVLFTMVRFVTYAAPVGVFGAMAYTTGNFGAATIGALLTLVGTFYATSLVFVLVVLGSVLLLVGLHPLRTFRYFRSEILLALGSSSSEVAIPGIVRKLENVGVSKGTAGISVSAGYSFNLDGTCLYLTLSSMFIAQALGIELTFGEQLVLLLVMLLSSKGTAGVTGGGFVMLTTTVSSLSLIPVQGVMLVFGIDRFMSECRAVVNALGNAVAGLVISRWQGEITPAQVTAIMSGRRPGVLTEPADEAAAPVPARSGT
ncbi:cation:dicarboxylate symporter family transporter [Pseudonocardia sp. MH-G8]|uniref:cation:dicarboxylate symporter family transporter n=1 Tax=Pseudonocardia sp. MH-G8 TaxID=1854588 RepID=UPI000BA09461|nr:cation:dicarboxylase symporter family transporter [Pseudonocardia sp. MH-G8]OZM79437.1 C4-dicarboxylate transporter DctA [Pseudonocardia sp. MH-G8]